MKAATKTYLLGFSLFTSLVMGFLIANLHRSNTPSNSSIAYAIHTAYMGRDINIYTQEATAIIIGQVREISEPYLREDRGITSQQDIKIDVQEILKGNGNISDINILNEGVYTVVQSEKNGISFISEEK